MAKNIVKKVRNLKLAVHETAPLAVHFFAKDISNTLRAFQEEGNTDVLFLSSGGSALEALDSIDEDVISPLLTIGVLDERFDPSNRVSNYMQLRKTTFYKRAVARGCRLIDTSTKKGQTQEELADFYETELLNWRTLHPKGVIFVTMGLGSDGHTAGIMPFPEDRERFKKLFESSRLVVSYDAGTKNPYPNRITVTMSFLRKVNAASIFIVGAGKGPVFRRLIESEDCAEIPGCIMKSLSRGTVHVDRELMRGANYPLPKEHH